MILESAAAILAAASVFILSRWCIRRSGGIDRNTLAGWGRWALRLRAAAPWRDSLHLLAIRAGLGEERERAELAGWQVLALLCTLAILVLVPLAGAGPGASLLGALLPAALPACWLRDRLRRRRLAIDRALPWTLDLLTLAVEVGVDFNVALARVVELKREGPLATELAQVVRELRVGTGRREALAKLKTRIAHPPVGRFATAVIQADRLGTPLARVLRAQAAELRIARCQRAEKLAGEAPVKLLMPLLGCIFPTVFLVLFGPIAFAILFGGGLP